MNKLLIIIFCFAITQNFVFANQSNTYYFDANYPESKSVQTNGGVITTTISSDNGALATTLTPSFLISTNSWATQSLTMSATAKTSSGNVNAIFNTGTNKYIVLTNNLVIPASTSVSNITGGSPTATSNPNAIAYSVDNPTTYYGLAVSYNSTNKNWQLTTSTYGYMTTALNIPAQTPLANTFSNDDEAGNYKATITLSFN